MTAPRWRILVVATVCVLALSVAAATLDSAVEPSAGGGGQSDPPSVPPQAPDGELPVGSIGPPCVGWLATPWAALGLLGVLGGVAVVARHRYTRFEAIALTGGVAVPSLALYLLLTACRAAEALDGVARGIGGLPLIPQPGGAGSESGPAVPAMFLGLVVLAGLLLVVVLLYISLVDRADDARGEADDGDGSDAAAAARAAGDAAGRIEAGADPETEIHRAWRDMATHLDVARPATSTPGEFAEAAVAAGFSADAVGELTDLFEEVRYGGLDATTERTARARAALRRIEERYGGDESTVGPTSGGE